MKSVLALSLLATSALADYNLPIRYKCGQEWVVGSGVGICSTPTSLVTLKAKIPPTAGQIRAIDCQRKLMREDFNTKTWKTGWWLWARTIILPSETPKIEIPIAKQIKNCPIYLGVASYPDTGYQEAILLYTEPKDDFLYYSCAYGPWIGTKGGTGVCSSFANSTMRLKIQNAKRGILSVVGTGCGLNIERDIQGESIIEIPMPKDECLVDVLLTQVGESQFSRFLTLGIDPSKRELTKPLQLIDGARRRVVAPLGMETIGTEIFVGDKMVWSSGARTEESYHLDPRADNGQGLTNWQENAIACHTAYSGKLRSISGACYVLRTNQEVPFEVK